MYQDTEKRIKSYEPLWDNWHLGNRIGKGASSTVYTIEKTNPDNTKQYAALKVISITMDTVNGSTIETKIRKLNSAKSNAENEILNMTRLSGCPFIVHCNNYMTREIIDEQNQCVGYDFLIQMNYYSCLSKSFNLMNNYMDTNEVYKLAWQISKALQAAHELGIIHRDIKPDNIFIDEQNNYILGDFGVSKQLNRIYYSTVAGTQPFIAPEVYYASSSTKYKKNADIYSLGIVLYCLLNNNNLPNTNSEFSDEEYNDAIMDRLAGKAFGAPRNGGFNFSAIVMKACRYESSLRYQSINEMIFDLEHINDPSRFTSRDYCRYLPNGAVIYDVGKILKSTPPPPPPPPPPPLPLPLPLPPITKQTYNNSQPKKTKGLLVILIIVSIIALAIVGVLSIKYLPMFNKNDSSQSSGEETPISEISIDRTEVYDTLEVDYDKPVDIACPDNISLSNGDYVIENIHCSFQPTKTTVNVISDGGASLNAKLTAVSDNDSIASAEVINNNDGSYSVEVSFGSTEGTTTISLYNSKNQFLDSISASTRKNVSTYSSTDENVLECTNDGNGDMLLKPHKQGAVTVYWFYGSMVLYEKNITVGP